MKLWVDDIRNSPDESWQIARTVNQAINAIAYFEFDEISLDHDISHQIHMGALERPYPCAETFQAVAHFIASIHMNNKEWNPKITLHTSNPVGALQMEAILAKVGLKVERRAMGAANRLETIL